MLLRFYYCHCEELYIDTRSVLAQNFGTKLAGVVGAIKRYLRPHLNSKRANASLAKEFRINSAGEEEQPNVSKANPCVSNAERQASSSCDEGLATE